MLKSFPLIRQHDSMQCGIHLFCPYVELGGYYRGKRVHLVCFRLDYTCKSNQKMWNFRMLA